MNRSDALPVGNREKPSGWAPAVAKHARCFLLCVPNAARIPKFPSNPEKDDRYIAALASLKTGQITKALII
jgi:hypothetical protein